MHIRPRGNFLYELTASQVLPVPRGEAFSFFEDPRNLFDITPDWLRFVIKDQDLRTVVFEHAEFDYTIRWVGMTLPWRSRIIEYRPPERFTDFQIAGPYRVWSHLHVFETVGSGTRMTDTVTYRLPFGPAGTIVHALLVRQQLTDIFRFRALRIDAWARGEPVRKKRSGLDRGGQHR